MIKKELEQFSTKLLARILTQVCRDRESTEYGSCDRNWWHYKIRDFSSIILQQAGYAIFCATEILPIASEEKETLRDLARASALFWNKRAQKFHAFEEYYPCEKGYPPLAFSTLAVVKLVEANVVTLTEIESGLRRAAKQLLNRFEGKATNQQVAGMAALCWIRKIAPELIEENSFQSICEKTLACQHDEGWYMEYGGPDLGYLSVTMDCLWDAYDATGDDKFKRSAAKGLEFISTFVNFPTIGAGMHNARNTDYIVPYGITRFLNEKDYSRTASNILKKVYKDLKDKNHFLNAIDDRYYCHYIGHSIIRAVPLLEKLDASEADETVTETKFINETGHYFVNSNNIYALVSGKKGGITTMFFDDKKAVDFGWVIEDDEQRWVSHWWADFWNIDIKDNTIHISGYMTPHKDNHSTPFKHFVLRVLSITLGSRIISVLKNKLIFKKQDSSPYKFARTIKFDDNEVLVVDIFNICKNMKFRRASRSSKRHVASADSFNKEDLTKTCTSVIIKEKMTEKDGEIEIQTVYRRQR
jgi:hypothetical protein